MLVFLAVLPDFTAGVSEVLAPDIASTAPASEVVSFLLFVELPEEGEAVVLGDVFGLLPIAGRTLPIIGILRRCI